MNLNYQDLIPQDFADDSRVWIYQSNRQFTLDEVLQVDELLGNFADSSWKSHGADVKGFAKILFAQFIILIADETATGISGCSTDTSVRLIKNIEQDYNVDLFNRQALAFICQERIQLIPLSELNTAIEKDFISPDTLYFNNTIQTKKELLNHWITPVKHSWLAKRFALIS
jgi:hypothetical protein